MYLEENHRWVPLTGFCRTEGAWMTLFPVFVHSRSLSACMPFSPFSTTRESRLYVMLNIIRVTEPSVRWVKKCLQRNLICLMIEAVIIIGIKAEFRALIKRVKFLLIPFEEKYKGRLSVNNIWYSFDPLVPRSDWHINSHYYIQHIVQQIGDKNWRKFIGQRIIYTLIYKNIFNKNIEDEIWEILRIC